MMRRCTWYSRAYCSLKKISITFSCYLENITQITKMSLLSSFMWPENHTNAHSILTNINTRTPTLEHRYGPRQDQCVDIVDDLSQKSCPPFPLYCGYSEYTTPDSCCVCDGGTTIRAYSWDIASFTADLSLWNVQGVTDMTGAFSDMLEFNSDISSWNVSRVTNMTNMFRNAESFNSDLSRWNVENVVDMDGILEGATSLDVCNRGSICRSWIGFGT